MDESGQNRGSESQTKDKISLYRCIIVSRDIFEILVGLVRDYGS